LATVRELAGTPEDARAAPSTRASVPAAAPGADAAAAVDRYLAAVEKGLLKTMSKMGISAVSS
jgi:glutamate synthase (NADPH/NADH) large chain